MFDRKLNKNTQLPTFGIADIAGLEEALASVEIWDSVATNAATITTNTGTKGNSSVSIGANARASSTYGIAIGCDSSADKNDAIAIGHRANASSTYSTDTIAIGNNPNVAGQYAIAIGYQATTRGGNGLYAIGSMAIGGNAQVSGSSSTPAYYSMALGPYSVVTNVRDSVALGSESTPSRDREVSVGTPTQTRVISNATNPEFSQDVATKNYVDIANSYSTTETPTGGTWIDGKPIYRKVVVCDGLPNATTKTFPHNIANMDMIVDLRGEAFVTATGEPIVILNATRPEGLTFNIGAWTNRTDITVSTGSDRASLSANVIIEYTKVA